MITLMNAIDLTESDASIVCCPQEPYLYVRHLADWRAVYIVSH